MRSLDLRRRGRGQAVGAGLGRGDVRIDPGKSVFKTGSEEQFIAEHLVAGVEDGLPCYEDLHGLLFSLRPGFPASVAFCLLPSTFLVKKIESLRFIRLEKQAGLPCTR